MYTLIAGLRQTGRTKKGEVKTMRYASTVVRQHNSLTSAMKEDVKDMTSFNDCMIIDDEGWVVFETDIDKDAPIELGKLIVLKRLRQMTEQDKRILARALADEQNAEVTFGKVMVK